MPHFVSLDTGVQVATHALAALANSTQVTKPWRVFIATNCPDAHAIGEVERKLNDGGAVLVRFVKNRCPCPCPCP